MLTTCDECGGKGEVEYEYIRPMSFTNPCGDIYTVWEYCQTCDGAGEIEVREEDFED